MRQPVLEKNPHNTEGEEAPAREKRPRGRDTRQKRQEEEEQQARERQEEEDADDEDAHSPRPDIRARIIDSPGVIIGTTYANRSQRTRAPTHKYQAGAKKEPRTPGRGRGRGGRGRGAN